ncbi:MULTISPECIES: adenosylmethionine--8-amino-7-oxononanoate transaminase [Virgibacillus]|uniref:Adenosylmethionine-8-amino-7-oxononanoate aminotransferase n=1 Tax=Virgibacillus massiliensis TaxID=1462526 RepID=A0A024Q677_9BACI|nr:MULTISPECIES: adenosylmethionine--8-amino-7-oxononanoate transaminase [Virgibacillus]EQB38487.1 hypothetical protein M948_07845 [Virgibacillus sp. CM-4]MYL41193.1 adenosylmethionine--8-amino-7-oxononanoate transaminase [Virgibacillus massiliensis]CDQ38003.1 L-Lysine-8-amino-7-oxononanoate aminotransferase [Virgibacillus massiliensis]
MTNIDELVEMSKQHLWLPFTQMKDYDENPLIIKSGEGIMLKDIQGNTYYDGFSSVWLNVHGHRKEELDRAIREQLNQIAHSTLLGMTNLPATELARKLVEITPPSLTRVFYSDSGAEAVEIALKMAFQYWKNKGINGKTKFVTMKDGYHGDTIGAVSVGAVDIFHRIYQSLTFDSFHIPFPYVYRHSSGDPDACKDESLLELENLFYHHHQEIAGITVESMMQGAGGMRLMPSGYLAGVKALCKKYNVLLILDEVATGFGRTGEMFACNHENVDPDIMTVGKGITGGYLPIAATISTEEIYSAFYDDYTKLKTLFHGHSYTGNQLGCAVALANIDLFDKQKTIDHVKENTTFIQNKLTTLSKLKHVGDIRQLGFMTGIEIVQDKTTKKPFPWDQRVGYAISLKMRKLGMLTRPVGDTIVFMPPLASTKQELHEMIEIMTESIDIVTNRINVGLASTKK